MLLPHAAHRTIQLEEGTAIGAAYAWTGGQYCAIHAPRGVIGCGIYDINCANEFNMAFALAKGTPERPLREPEDLLDAAIVATSRAAERLGIAVGMTGRQALRQLLAAK